MKGENLIINFIYNLQLRDIRPKMSEEKKRDEVKKIIEKTDKTIKEVEKENTYRYWGVYKLVKKGEPATNFPIKMEFIDVVLINIKYFEHKENLKKAMNKLHQKLMSKYKDKTDYYVPKIRNIYTTREEVQEIMEASNKANKTGLRKTRK